MAGPTRNRGSTLTGGVLDAVSQVHCDASRDHKWLVNDVLAGALTLPTLGVEEGEVPTLIRSAPVNLCETESVDNHCAVVASSFGSLIQATAGSSGGVGTFRTNRSGWAA